MTLIKKGFLKEELTPRPIIRNFLYKIGSRFSSATQFLVKNTNTTIRL